MIPAKFGSDGTWLWHEIGLETVSLNFGSSFDVKFQYVLFISILIFGSSFDVKFQYVLFISIYFLRDVSLSVNSSFDFPLK